MAVLGVLSLSGSALASAPLGSIRGSAGLAGPVVALGDSYTAGNLVGASPAGSSPFGCLRSTRNYGADVARALHAASFVDGACNGATTASMARSERTLFGTNPPQFSYLARNDSLVMLTLGGDNLGFTHVLVTCTLLSFIDPWGAPCENHYAGGGTDRLAAAVAAARPGVAAALRGIHRRAPRARVLLLGYPDILPVSGGGCWPVVPIASGDVGYLRGTEVRLNRMLASVAAANGATFVDTYRATIGHDVCEPTAIKDIEGLIPTSLAFPFHPNARGQRVMADRVIAALH
ncbi:MAG: SGNH/GDSL hydrolase family protein [Streptosporangiaceae bacterium]|nr:SGNH/GDSL hydrolase family protein [Streptosporangiaceae bacterium]